MRHFNKKRHEPRKTREEIRFERETDRRRSEMLRHFAQGRPLQSHQIPRGTNVLMALLRARKRPEAQA